MLLDNWLTQQSSFKVLHGPVLTPITPVKDNGSGHSNMNLDENGEVVVVVGLTEPNEEVYAIGDCGKADWSTYNSTKTDEEDDRFIEELGGSEDD